MLNNVLMYLYSYIKGNVAAKRSRISFNEDSKRKHEMNKRLYITCSVNNARSSSTRDIQYHGVNVVRHQCAMSRIYEWHTRHTRVYSCWKYMRFITLLFFSRTTLLNLKIYHSLRSIFFFSSYIVLVFFCQWNDIPKNVIL